MKAYIVRSAKVKAMSKAAKSLVKLLQLFFVRLGMSPKTMIVRNVDLPNGLTLYHLIYWMGFAIEKASERAWGVLPVKEAVSHLNRWSTK